MTKEEFINLKVHDIFWCSTNYGVTKNRVTYKSPNIHSVMKSATEYGYFDNYLIHCNNYFLTERECIIYHIKETIRLKNKLIESCQKQIKEIKPEYADFIEKNIEEFI